MCCRDCDSDKIYSRYTGVLRKCFRSRWAVATAYIKKRCKKLYQPNREFGIDERMVRSKARFSFRQYIRNKPTKWGFKLWYICDSYNGYTSCLSVYRGKSVVGRSPTSTDEKREVGCQAYTRFVLADSAILQLSGCVQVSVSHIHLGSATWLYLAEVK